MQSSTSTSFSSFEILSQQIGQRGQGQVSKSGWSPQQELGMNLPHSSHTWRSFAEGTDDSDSLGPLEPVGEGGCEGPFPGGCEGGCEAPAGPAAVTGTRLCDGLGLLSLSWGLALAPFSFGSTMTTSGFGNALESGLDDEPGMLLAPPPLASEESWFAMANCCGVVICPFISAIFIACF